jgi:membrane-bound acyltransferase YfiQ involved in biofilm formation
MKTVKNLIFGYVFGFALVWLLYFIIPMIMGESKKIGMLLNYVDDILAQSLVIALISAVLFVVIGMINERKREKRELEEAMIDYFKSKSKGDE